VAASEGGTVKEAVRFPVVWTPEANEDLLKARAGYDNVRPQLGERFAQAVQATVETMAEYPLHFAVVYRSRRRAGVHRFPYGIFFEVQEHRIVVIAYFHGRRDPRRWQSRK
jgi:plasmid stabilization system protein ParE